MRNFFKPKNHDIVKAIREISKLTGENWQFDDYSNNGKTGNIFIGIEKNGNIDIDSTSVYCCSSCTLEYLKQLIEVLKRKIPN